MIRILSLVLLIAVLPTGVPAAETGLYTGVVAVDGQGAAEREDALPRALAHVLRKLSGVRDFGAYPDLDDALRQAPALLVTFYYQTVELPLAEGAVRTELRLYAQFAEAGVDELMQQLQLPVWLPNRRPAETWVVLDDGAGRRILPPEYAYLQGFLDDIAAQRGLSLRWPQADEEGMYPVDLQLLWGGYTEDLASPLGDAVLILSAGREGPLWYLRANLGFREQNWSWRTREIDLEAGLKAMLQQAIDQIAAASAIAPSDLGSWEWQLRVAGLRGADDYRACLAYLQGLSIVDRVAVQAAAPGAATFDLHLSASPRYLEEALANSSVLEYRPEQDHYRLRGAADER
jgi:hypothetical protein